MPVWINGWTDDIFELPQDGYNESPLYELYLKALNAGLSSPQLKLSYIDKNNIEVKERIFELLEQVEDSKDSPRNREIKREILSIVEEGYILEMLMKENKEQNIALKELTDLVDKYEEEMDTEDVLSDINKQIEKYFHENNITSITDKLAIKLDLSTYIELRSAWLTDPDRYRKLKLEEAERNGIADKVRKKTAETLERNALLVELMIKK